MIVIFFDMDTGETTRMVDTEDPERVIESQNIQPSESWAVYDTEDIEPADMRTCCVDPDTCELVRHPERTTPEEDFLDARECCDVQGQLDALFEMLKGIDPEEEQERQEQVDGPPIQPHERPGEIAEGS